MSYKVCPRQLVIDGAAKLSAVLWEMSRAINVQHLVLGFATSEDRWRFERELSVQPMQTADTETKRGLIGKALRTNRVCLYPDDEEHRSDFLDLPENPTKFELAAPMHYDGEPTGVLLGDVYRWEEWPALRGETLKDYLIRYTSKLSSILDSHPTSEPTLRSRINSLVDTCILETVSKRGYLALKHADGELRYFDLNNETFLELSPIEGLCGAVFKLGVTLNAPDVSTQPNYVASDPNIKSEIVVPIRDGLETVAVLNMESTERGHYGEDNETYSPYGEYVIRAANEAQELVLAFRKLSGSDSSVIDVVQELIRYDGSLEDGTFARFVSGRLSYALRTDRHPVWVVTDPESPRPAEFDGVDPRSRGGVDTRPIRDGLHLTHAPLRRLGEKKAILGFVTKDPPQRAATNIVEQVCRIAGEVLELKKQATSASLLERIVDLILNSPDSVTLHRVVANIKEVVGADHCTLYGCFVMGTESYLMVYASTADSIFEHVHSEMYYKLGRTDGYYDGYTGYVGSERVAFHTSNLSDMSQKEKQHWDSQGVRWKRGMSEDGEAPVAAFICEPICDASRRLLGVIRLSRAKGKGKLGDFDELSKQRIKSLCRMLGQAYASSGLFPLHDNDLRVLREG